MVLTVRLSLALEKRTFPSTDGAAYNFVIAGFPNDADVEELMRLHGDAIVAKGWQKKTNKILSYTMLVPPAGCTFAEAKSFLTQTCQCTYAKFMDSDTEVYLVYERMDDGDEPVSEPVGKLLYDDLADDPTTDFALIDSDGNEFKVHKCVLRARSSVLSQLFGNDEMMQADDDLKQSRLRMAAAGSEALKAFVCALYTREYKLQYNREPDIVQQLLLLADMYNVQDLKVAIEKELVASVNRENARKLAVIADRFDLQTLLKKLFCGIKDK